MATITRTEAIEQIQEVLKAYENKIRDIRFNTEKLSPEGKNIVDSYCSNEENEQVLVKKAYSKKKFFKKVNETQLLEFYKVCYELNKNLSLDVKELLLITAIEEDKESFWESFWGALQGEFNEDPSGLSIMLDMGLNFIPFVGQVLDARDILACLDKLIRQKRTHEIMIWVTLVLTAIGCVPYAGDVIKAIGKAIVKGADDIIITLLKKLDAEDVYKAFIKFYNKINESTEEAIKIINQWLLEAEKRYNETDLSELIRNANEYINKAIEFIQTKIDEFAQKMFGNENINKIAKNKTSFANQAQVDAVYSIKSPNEELVNIEHPHDYTMKSNYGEMKTDIDLEKNGGYQRVSNFRVTSLKAKGHHGIDGIYRNMNPPPDFIIVDSKYLGTEKAVNEAFAPTMSKVKGGRQMDSKWIEKNLADSIDDDDLLFEILDSIGNGRVDSVAAKIDNTGKLTYYQLDNYGKVKLDEMNNSPIIYNINKE